MALIAPSILASDFSRLGEEVRRISDAGCDWIHIDVMDGRFVPNITIGPAIIKSLRPYTNKPFDVHLMIEDPIRYVDDFIQSGADWLTVHAEGATHLHRLIYAIKDKGAKAGVAINPATNVNVLEPIIKDIDLVLVMSVNPGFGGQTFIEESLNKIRKVKQMIDEAGTSCLIEVDGGITLENYKSIVEAGASVLVAGSSVFLADDLEKRIQEFKK